MAIASNIPEDDEWFQRYRADRAARAGRGYINGAPSEQALAGVERSQVQPAPGVLAVTPQQADRAMVSAEQIGADRAIAQQDYKNDRRDRYNMYLREQGINPDRIGASTLEGDMGNRTMRNPSLAQQQLATDVANQANSQEARARIAARRMFRQDPYAWASVMNDVYNARDARTNPNSAQANQAYWMGQLMQGFPFRQGLSSNGFY